MAGQRTQKTLVEGISDDDALIRFERELAQRYRLNKLSITQDSQTARMNFCLACYPDTPVTLQIWQTDTIMIQGSPKIPQKGFETEVESIFQLGKECLDSKPDPEDTTELIRARTMLAYLKNMDPKDEVERMVIVSLCDIVIDLLMCHKIEILKMPPGIKTAYLPTKISEINKKEVVYRDDEIERLHRLRNQIAHGGALLTKDEAKWALELTKDVEKHT